MDARGLGVQVGRYFAAVTKPVLWGLLAGGTGLALFPSDGRASSWSWPVVVVVAVVLGAAKPPRGTRLLDLPQRSQLLRVVAATGIAVAAAAAGIAPSAFVTGAVVHLAYKAMRWRPLPAAVIAGSLLTLVVAGWVVPVDGPHVLLTSGDPVAIGTAVRDLVRMLVLGFVVFAATKDQRTVDAAEAARDAAVRDERVRIARELHDVVAHHVSVMTIQAEAAGQPAVAEVGRTAMTELRRMVGVLRTGDDPHAAGLAPQPGLDDLERLVAEVRSTGTPVSLSIDGELPASMTEGVELSIHRIVQEALTNALRHSSGAPVEVRITYGPSAVRVEVENEGPATARGGLVGVGVGVGGGHGIVGMRERARLLDGVLTAGPRDDGTGWVVRADVPFG